MADGVHAENPSIHFIPGAPLLLEGCRLSSDIHLPGLYLKWRNLDQQALRMVSITLYCYNEAHELLAFSSHQYDDLHALQGEAFGDDMLIPCQPDHPCRVEVELHGAAFDQGSAWQPEKETWYSLSLEQPPLDSAPPQEAQEQKKEDEAQPEIMEAPADMPQKPAPRRNRRPARVILPCALLLVIVAVCAVIFYVIPEKNYQAAQELLSRGEYDAASQAFREVGNYKDAPQMILGVYYTEAEARLAQGDREGAIAAFAKAGDYTNAPDRIDAIRYQQAQSLLTQGQEEAAFTLFSSIPHYEDAAAQARNIRLDQAGRAMAACDYAAAAAIYAGLGEDENAPIYAHAQSLFQQGQYGMAADAWQFIIDYQDSREQIYQCALAASAAQDYALSIPLFTFLSDYQDSKARILSDTYAKGQMLLQAGENSQALDIFLALGEYEAAPVMALEARYRIAAEDLQKGNYAQAKAAFLALQDYQDSPRMALEADYQQALAACAAQEYPDAIHLFTDLANYKDSADRLIQARYGHAVLLLQQENYDEAIAGFIALNHYQDSDQMLLQAYYGKALALSARSELAAAYDYFLLAQNYQDAPQLALDHAFNHALQLQALEQFEDALAWYALAGDHPQIAQQKFLIGEAYFARQLYDQSLAVLKECPQAEGAQEYLYALGQYFESAQLPVRAYAAYVYAGDYMDSGDRRIILMEHMKILAAQALSEGRFQEADLMYETMALGGMVFEESLQAEFLSFLTQPGRKLTLGTYPQGPDGAAAPVIWRVLESGNGYATLLAEQPLGCAQFESRSDNRVSDLLISLSDMFAGLEKECTGNCYLLTQKELKKYLPAARDRITVPTAYAQSQFIEKGTYRTEGVWTADQSDSFNYVIYDPDTGIFNPASLSFKTNYVRPAVQLRLNATLYQLMGNAASGYLFFDAQGNEVPFQSRYQ